MAKCVSCGIEFKDGHPERKSNKFCCREHFRQYKKIHGCGNKGKTWEETYSPETLKFMKNRINSKGKNHFNYNGKRIDTTLRNLLHNPQRKKEVNDKIIKLFSENPTNAMKMALDSMGTNKIYAYQRKAYSWGKYHSGKLHTAGYGSGFSQAVPGCFF